MPVYRLCTEKRRYNLYLSLSAAVSHITQFIAILLTCSTLSQICSQRAMHMFYWHAKTIDINGMVCQYGRYSLILTGYL